MAAMKRTVLALSLLWVLVVSRRYLYDPAVDQILATDNGGGNVLWGLGNNVGTIRDVVNSTGALVDHVQFDSFGKPLSTMAADVLFGEAGMRYDPATGEYRTAARVYDPVAGRPLSADPLGLTPDTNPYRWCGNNPVVRTDPSGLCYTGLGVANAGSWFAGPTGFSSSARLWTMIIPATLFLISAILGRGMPRRMTTCRVSSGGAGTSGCLAILRCRGNLLASTIPRTRKQCGCMRTASCRPKTLALRRVSRWALRSRSTPRILPPERRKGRSWLAEQPPWRSLAPPLG